MAKINWTKFNKTYADSKVGMSIDEQDALDAELRAKGGVTSQAGLSIDEQAAVGKPMGNATMISGPSGGDMRTDEYMANAAQATVPVSFGSSKMAGGLAGFTDKRSKEFLSVYGPGGALNRMSKTGPKERVALQAALQPNDSLDSLGSFVGPYGNTPHYYDALVAAKGLRNAKQSLRKLGA